MRRHTPTLGMLCTFLGRINHSFIWKRTVKVHGASFLPPTLDRWVALQAHRLGLMGTDEIALFQRFVQPDSRIADVGANQGIYTLFLARLASFGQVYAFEPDPTLFASLEANVRRNHVENVTLFNAAAASEPNRLTLQPGQLHRGNNRIISDVSAGAGTVEVEAIPLDQVIPSSRLDLLKIDVQGFELNVLHGATQLLQQNHALVILLEFWPYGLRQAGSAPEELLDFLHTTGFSIFRCPNPTKREQFTYRSTDWNQSSRFCNLVATRGQILGRTW
jgi:FkbM family methyltransferase